MSETKVEFSPEDSAAIDAAIPIMLTAMVKNNTNLFTLRSKIKDRSGEIALVKLEVRLIDVAECQPDDPS